MNIIAPILAIMPILVGVYYGWACGATLTVRHLIAHLFALIVAMSLWHWLFTVLESAIHLDPRMLASIAFCCLYVAAFALSAFAVHLRAPVYRSVQPNPIDQVLGVLAGGAAGSIVGGALALATSLLASANTPLGEMTLITREWPARVLRTVESQAAGIPADSPEAAKLPSVEFEQEEIDPNAQPDENGYVTVRLLPKVTWN